MAWKVEKNGRRSYLAGTAHFFPYSFARSLTKLLQPVETIIFEGPLDEESMKQIAEHGRQGENSPSLAEALEAGVIKEINKQLSRRLDHQSGSDLYLLLQPPRPNYFELYTHGLRPWMAFFSIWSTYLNWQYSVDMEAFRIARRLGKNIHFLETIDEQLAVLDGIPFERIVSYLNDVKNWKSYTDRYVSFFLAGNIQDLMALTNRFASRGPTVISQRDIILFQRMKTIFEEEDAVAFVGFPHLPGVNRLFLDQGYSVSQGVE